MISRTMVVWVAPAGVALTTIAGNVWMAVVYAAALAQLGVLGAGTQPLIGWSAFFSLLAANNMVVLLVFARWLTATRRQETIQDEVLAAMRWRQSVTARATATTEGFATAPAASFNIRFAQSYHLPHVFSFMATLVAPATLIGALVLA